MKKNQKISCLFFLFTLSTAYLHGQETITTAGGSATGSGGSVTYTVGQVAYYTFTGTNDSVAQGVQQPYEISVVTGMENTEDIYIEYNVYPNPTAGSFMLIVRSSEHNNMRFRLFNLNGLLLEDRKIESEETEISLRNFSSSIYLLKVMDKNREVKVFKIVKK
jgi:hypothetical protein